ncbi:hypothetical protein [Mycobacteroides stephanolepidis]|uniref:hypothetical protein n=1 Tax=[Mycobacterium] stephanolepidis TaxID=1520670 RepID=UPI001E5A656C|nr:hypothetical protein [[Mycobacterium] stephanolepidis]
MPAPQIRRSAVTARHRQGFTPTVRIQRAIAYLAVITLSTIAARAAATILADGIDWHTTLAALATAIPAWMILDGLTMTAPANCRGCQHPMHDGVCWCGHV